VADPVGLGGKAIFEGLIIEIVPHRSEKSLVTQNPAEHVKQERALVIGEPGIKYPGKTGSILHINRSVRLSDNFFQQPAFPGFPVYSIKKVFIGETRGIGGKSLVQPDIMPGGQCDAVAEPGVGQFVSDEFKIETTHETHGLVFHTSSPSELGVAIFFIRKGVFSEQPVIQADQVKGNCCV